MLRRYCCCGQHRELTVLLVGLDNAGKTSILYALKRDNSEVTPTFGFSSATITAAGCRLHIYDLGGSKNIRRIWTVYTAEVHGVIYVVDAADSSRWQESHVALQRLLETQQLAGKPVLVLANKQDMSAAHSSAAVSLAFNILELQQGRASAVYTCTARHDTQQQQAQLDPGIKHGLQWLVNAIDPIYPQLRAKVDQESAAARALEQQRKQEREERARQNKLERLQQEKEAEEQQQKRHEVESQQVAGEQIHHAEVPLLIKASYEATIDSSAASFDQRGRADVTALPPSVLVPAFEARHSGQIAAATSSWSNVGWPATANGAEPAPAGTDHAPGSLEAAATPQAVTSPAAGCSERPDIMGSILYQASSPASADHHQGQSAAPVPLINFVQAVLPGMAESPEFSDLQKAARDECGPTPRLTSIDSQASSNEEATQQ